MSQEEINKKFDSNEKITNSPEETSNPVEAAFEAAEQTNSQEIDNLPIESIGSYARLEESLTDEEKEKMTNPTTQS